MLCCYLEGGGTWHLAIICIALILKSLIGWLFSVWIDRLIFALSINTAISVLHGNSLLHGLRSVAAEDVDENWPPCKADENIIPLNMVEYLKVHTEDNKEDTLLICGHLIYRVLMFTLRQRGDHISVQGLRNKVYIFFLSFQFFIIAKLHSRLDRILCRRSLCV